MTKQHTKIKFVPSTPKILESWLEVKKNTTSGIIGGKYHMHHDSNKVLEVENPTIWHLQHHMNEVRPGENRSTES